MANREIWEKVIRAEAGPPINCDQYQQLWVEDVRHRFLPRDKDDEGPGLAAILKMGKHLNGCNNPCCKRLGSEFFAELRAAPTPEVVLEIIDRAQESLSAPERQRAA